MSNLSWWEEDFERGWFLRGYSLFWLYIQSNGKSSQRVTCVCGFAPLHGARSMHSLYKRVQSHTCRWRICWVLTAESIPRVPSKATNSALYSDMILCSGDYCRAGLRAPFAWSRPSVSWTLLFLAWRNLSKDDLWLSQYCHIEFPSVLFLYKNAY